MNDFVQIHNLIYEVRGLKVMLDSDLCYTKLKPEH